MYEYLEGTVAARSAARLVLDVTGVGFELAVPIGASFPETGSNARVWVHLVVREDAHTLYGFPDRELRELFRLLLKVRGVGPAMALGVLSGLGGAELAIAIQNEDLAALQRVKGVGKKTAEQILLDLRDKAGQLSMTFGRGDEIPRPEKAAPSGVIQDAAAALVSVGYSEKDALRQVEKASKKVDPSDLELLVRTALGA